MTDFLAVLVVGLGSYALRSVFILALANRQIPPAVITALDYVAPAVLAALVVSLLVDPQGRLAVGPAEAAALVTGAAVMWKARNFLLSAGIGMAVFWLVGALF